MKKNLVITGMVALMMIFSTTVAMADTVAYNYDDNTVQGWVIDTTGFYGDNIKTIVPSTDQGQDGSSHSLKLEVDLDETVGEDPDYINDSIYVLPSPPANLQGYSRVKAYIYVPTDTAILDAAPLNMGVYIKTGSDYFYWSTDADQRVNISGGDGNFDSWVPVDINFSVCQSSTGVNGQQATDINDVKEVGVSFSGCGTSDGGGTSAADIEVYVDSITWVGAAASTDITVTVMGVSLGVSITGTVAFGDVTMGSQTISTNQLIVTNTGTAPETYSLCLVDPSVWTAVDTNPGNETYVLGAVFNAGMPGLGSFVAPEDSVLGNLRKCTGSVFAAGQTGVAVPMSVARDLWLLFRSPLTTESTTEQVIRLIVSAEAS